MDLSIIQKKDKTRFPFRSLLNYNQVVKSNLLKQGLNFAKNRPTV